MSPTKPSGSSGSDRSSGSSGSGGPRPADALKRLQNLGAQAAASARSLTEEFARTASTRTPDPMMRMGAQLWQLSTMWVTPIQAILKEQREFYDVMSEWAKQQKTFADRMQKLVDSNQRITDQLTELLGPFIEQAEAAREAV